METWAEIKKRINQKQVIHVGDITIDIRNESVLYVTIGDWTIYIDDSTNEKIISTWVD